MHLTALGLVFPHQKKDEVQSLVSVPEFGNVPERPPGSKRAVAAFVGKVWGSGEGPSAAVGRPHEVANPGNASPGYVATSRAFCRPGKSSRREGCGILVCGFAQVWKLLRNNYEFVGNNIDIISNTPSPPSRGSMIPTPDNKN